MRRRLNPYFLLAGETGTLTELTAPAGRRENNPKVHECAQKCVIILILQYLLDIIISDNTSGPRGLYGGKKCQIDFWQIHMQLLK